MNAVSIIRLAVIEERVLEKKPLITTRTVRYQELIDESNLQMTNNHVPRIDLAESTVTTIAGDDTRYQGKCFFLPHQSDFLLPARSETKEPGRTVQSANFERLSLCT